MATLAEQRTAAEDSNLRIKVQQAMIVSAQKVIDEAVATTNHANRLLWAKRVIPPVDSETMKVLMYIIAKNNGLTLAQILAVTDAQVQTAVDGAVDALSP